MAVHKSFFEKRDELSGQMNLLDKEVFRLNQQLEKLEESQEQKIAYMWEEYEITPNSAYLTVSRRRYPPPPSRKRSQ